MSFSLKSRTVCGRLALAAALALGAAQGRAESPAPTKPDAPAKTISQITISDLLAPPRLVQAVLSPSGKHLAMVEAKDQSDIVTVYDIDAHTAIRVVDTDGWERSSEGRKVKAKDDDPDGPHVMRIAALIWKNEDTLVIRAGRQRTKASVLASRALVGHVYFSVDARKPQPPRLITVKTEAGPTQASVIDAQRSDPSHLMLGVPTTHGADVYRYDLRDQTAVLVERGQMNAGDYVIDHQGNVVGRTVVGGVNWNWRIVEGRAPGDTKWTKITDVWNKDLKAFAEFEILGATEHPGQFYVISRPREAGDGNTSAVRVYDLKTKAVGPVLWRQPDYDVDDIVVAAGDGSLLAGCYWVDSYRCDFSDPLMAKHLKAISAFFDGERSVVVASISDDRQRWLLSVSGPDERGSYYLYDLAKHKVDLVGARYPTLPTARLGPTRRFDYKARDGAALSGYVTEPAVPPRSPPPLIVMPHGGPEARDHYDFDEWAQFFASRGYVVFQPNFRGSEGFGRAFAEAGYRQWGARMQDDVTDGVHALIAEHKLDPARMCVVGASYGGYVALYAGAADPAAYRCVISVAGVSDLPRIMAWEKRNFGTDSGRYKYWTKSIGDPDRDQAAMEAKSPARLAANFRAPVLLVHGTYDTTVPIEQSQVMKQALEKAGKPVRYLEVPKAGHGGWSQEDETKILLEMEGFLAENLKPQAPAPAQ